MVNAANEREIHVAFANVVQAGASRLERDRRRRGGAGRASDLARPR
jgi:hypothetical protein